MLFDWGASVDGYASDLTRMFSFGPPDEELLRLVDQRVRLTRRLLDLTDAYTAVPVA